jgi:heme/copper-type cytochrome/quinol oxidase subunit 3
MIRGRALDVSGLPESSTGHRTTLWWGVVALLAIEGMAFALVIASYFYGRMTEETWPPMGTAVPPLAFGTGNLAVHLLSAIPMALTVRAARAQAVKRVASWLAAATVLVVAALVLRALELGTIHAPADRTFYGSIVWLLLVLHTLHLATSLGENLLIIAVMMLGQAHEEHFVDAEVNGLYWYFVVVSWVVIYAVVYFAPRLL